jgi:DNA polymerase-4
MTFDVAGGRRILHCDMDCFYAAVHMRDDPRLAGRPVVVGGDPSGRGVVASASYEARAFGVRSAMPAARARRLCPQALFVRPDFAGYSREAERIFEIYRRYTPAVEIVGLDEAYLDVTGRLDPFGTATAIAREIRRRVREDRRLTVSVGVGPNKLIAKIASDAAKPDGVTVVPPARVRAFLDPLPVRSLPGVGPVAEKTLLAIGVRTVAQLRARPIGLLAARLGRRWAEGLLAFAEGRDDRPVESRGERKSLGSENTFARDLTSGDAIEAEVERMARGVAEGMAEEGIAARTVTLKVRYADFATVTRSTTLASPTAEPRRLVACAVGLVEKTEAGRRPVRLLGVSVSNLIRADAKQLLLFTP